MEKEKIKKISLNLMTNHDDYMYSFRHNIDTYIKEKAITIRELSEKSDIPFSTLNSFLYGDAKDCKLSTAIALAKTLNVSVDELVGAGTFTNTERSNIAKYRNLPKNSRCLIDWYINHQVYENENTPKGKCMISVMQAKCNQNGNLKPQDVYERIDISKLHPDIRTKVFFGLQIPCEHYMPHYTPYNILLIANDRTPNHNEHTLVMNGGSLYIAKRSTLDKPAYYSIRDGRFRYYESEVDEVIGYVADIIRTLPQVY